MTVDEDPEEQEEQAARIRACEAAVAAIANASRQDDPNHDEAASDPSPISAAASRLIQAYQARITTLRVDEAAAEGLLERSAADRMLRLVGVRAEREEVMRLHREDEINDVVLNALLYEIDMRETSLTTGSRKREH